MGTFIPCWIFLGFSIIFSIEKWFRLYTVAKWISRFYRLILNIGILTIIILLIWSGIGLFSKNPLFRPLTWIILFAVELTTFIWLFRVYSRNSWRRPGMLFTLFLVMCILIILAFAGIQPMTSYKDRILPKINDILWSCSPPTITSTSGKTITPPNSITSTISTLIPQTFSTTTTQISLTPATSTSMMSFNSIINPPVTAGNPSKVDRSRFTTIDQHALATPESATKSIDSLATYLVQPATNEF